MDSSWKRAATVLALAGYVLAALAVTYPAVLHLGSHVLGDTNSDACAHCWDLWRAGQAFADRGALIAGHTDLLAHPDGGALVNPSPLHDWIAIPLQALFGVIAAYNLIMIGNLVLAAAGAFFLVRYLLKDVRAAFVAGLIYGFCPFLLSYAVASGGLEMVAAGWLPLAVLFTLRTLREDRWRDPLAAGLCIAAMDLTCVYYVSVFGLLFVGLVAHHLLTARRGTGAPPLRSMALRLAVIPVLSLALAAPHLILLARSLSSPDSLLAEKPEGRRLDLQEAGDGGDEALDAALLVSTQGYGSVFLVNTVWPGPVQRVESVCRFLLNPYAGLSVLLLAVVGFVFGRRRMLAPWLAALGVFLLIAMGPYLMVSEALHLRRPASPVFLALDWLYPVHPLGHESSYYLVCMLSLAILAGAGVVAVAAGIGPRWRSAVAVAAGAVVLADFLLLSAGPVPIPQRPAETPPCYLDLAAELVEGGILELPLHKGGTLLTNREKFCYQTVHGLPLADDLTGFLPSHLQANPLVAELTCVELGGGRCGTPLDELDAGYEELVAGGVGVLVVDSRAYLPAAWEVAGPLLDHFAGPGTGYPDGFRTFDLSVGRGSRITLRQASEVFLSGDMSAAQREFEALLAAPLNEDERRIVDQRLAKIAYLSGEGDRAIAILQDRLGRVGIDDVAEADTLYELGKLYLRTGRTDQARTTFRTVADQLHPARRERWGVHWSVLRLAAMAAREGQVDQALSTYQGFLDDPAFFRQQEEVQGDLNAFYIQCYIAQDLRRFGRAEQAAALLERLLTDYPLPEAVLLARLELAKCHQELGQREAAESLYGELLSWDSYMKHSETMQYLGLLDYLDDDFGTRPWVAALVREFRTRAEPHDLEHFGTARRTAINMPRPSDGLD